MECNSWNCFDSSSGQNTNTSSSRNNYDPQQRQDHSNHSNISADVITILILIFVVFLVIFLLSRWLVYCHYHREIEVTRKETRIECIKTHLPSRTIQLETSDSKCIEKQEEEEELRKQQQQQDDDEGMDEEKGNVRKEVMIHSMTSTANSSCIINNEDDGNNDNNKSDSPETSLQKRSRKSLAAHNCSRLCSICLGSYHRQEDVAWSTNPACPHLFHRACIEPWLFLHEECPLCRCVFLPQQEQQQPPTSITIPPFVPTEATATQENEQ